MTRMRMRSTGICACLAIMSGAIVGGFGGLPPATAAGSPETEKSIFPKGRTRTLVKRQEPPPPYFRGTKLIKAGKFGEARKALERARSMEPKHPDVLNMLAYSQSKTGALDLAIDNYKNALRQRPDFPQAREYLGEAYLEAALRELTALERAGTTAEREHAALLRALHDATAKLPPPPDVSDSD